MKSSTSIASSKLCSELYGFMPLDTVGASTRFRFRPVPERPVHIRDTLKNSIGTPGYGMASCASSPTSYIALHTLYAQNGTYLASFFDPLDWACGLIRSALIVSAIIREAMG